MMIFACTTNIRKTSRFIYSDEMRDYLVTRYRVIYSAGSVLCRAFDRREDAEAETRIKPGRVEAYEKIEYVVLHHRYINRAGR